MVAAAIADDVIAACLPEVVGQRIAGPDKTVLLGVSGDKWVVGATKQIKAGVRAIEKQLRAPVIVEFAPLVADSPEEQAYNVIALQRLATIATDAELTRGGVSWPVMLGAETEVLIAGASGMERCDLVASLLQGAVADGGADSDGGVCAGLYWHHHRVPDCVGPVA
jgi:hypothetical protein